MITSQQQKSTFFFYHVGIFEVTPFEKKAKNLRFLAFEVTCMLIYQLNLFADGFFWWVIKMIFFFHEFVKSYFFFLSFFH